MKKVQKKKLSFEKGRRRAKISANVVTLVLGLIFIITVFVMVYNNRYIDTLLSQQKQESRIKFRSERKRKKETTSSSSSSAANLKACTQEELNIIQYQLSPDKCYHTGMYPWRNKCSYSTATSCPEPIWLYEYYQQQQQQLLHEKEKKEKRFLSFIVGCNKADDAINILRMGSGNSKYDVDQWRSTLAKTNTNNDSSKTKNSNKFEEGRCIKEQYKFPIFIENNNNNEFDDVQHRHRRAQVYCFEPMPVTFRELERTKEEVGWFRHHDDNNDKFILEQIVLSNKNNSTMLVPVPSLDNNDDNNTKNVIGIENLGISNYQKECSRMKDGSMKTKCQEIPVMTLDEYYRTRYDTTIRKNKDNDNEQEESAEPTIQFLSIDVEGYDFDVLAGASEEVLHRVEYLEFEYNWMGSWSNQSLYDAITMLKTKYGFVCYWPGTNQNIWRITDCWLEHYYKTKFWSNVHCVNTKIINKNNENYSLIQRMEELFQQTLQKGTNLTYDMISKDIRPLIIKESKSLGHDPQDFDYFRTNPYFSHSA